MKTEEMIKALEKKGYEIWESKKFLNVKLSDMKGVLLRAESGRILVETWNNWTKDILNDFEYIQKYNLGQLWIRGDINKFEFVYNGEWIECDKLMDVRFLR